MSLIPYQPFFDFDQIWKNMKLASGDNGTGLLSPKVDIAEKDKNYLISAEFPGVDSDNINVTLEDGLLTISAETQSEDKKEEEGKIIYQERKYGKFSRSFNVGRSIQEGDITAKSKDGILTLTVPKQEEQVEKSRRIPIHS